MKEIQTVAIVGMGALGVLYGQLLSQKLDQDHLFFLGDDARINKLNNEKVYCNKEECNFRMINPIKENTKVDLLIFSVKSTALLESIELARPIVSKDTVIISVLNGITSEEIIEDKLHRKYIIKSVAQGMDAVKIGNQMTYQNFGQICLGISKSEEDKKEALDRLMNFFDFVNLPYTNETDINRRLWGKWMLNIGVNQVVMVNEGTYRTIQQEGPARERMKLAMQEVIMVAQKSGVQLTQDDFNAYIKLVDSLSASGMPSMRQDGLVKRKSEVELFSGALIKKAQLCNVEVPINQALYQEIIKIESNY